MLRSKYTKHENFIQAGGIKALYNGWGAYMMKMVPAIGIEMAAIEVCMGFFKEYTG